MTFKWSLATKEKQDFAAIINHVRNGLQKYLYTNLIKTANDTNEWVHVL